MFIIWTTFSTQYTQPDSRQRYTAPTAAVRPHQNTACHLSEYNLIVWEWNRLGTFKKKKKKEVFLSFRRFLHGFGQKTQFSRFLVRVSVLCSERERALWDPYIYILYTVEYSLPNRHYTLHIDNSTKTKLFEERGIASKTENRKMETTSEKQSKYFVYFLFLSLIPFWDSLETSYVTML